MQKIEAKHINFGLMALTAFLIPLYQPLVRYAIGFLVLSTFFNFRKGSGKDLLKLTPLLFYFVWLLIGLIWTEDKPSGWKEIEYSLSFLLFPLIFSFSKVNIQHSVSKIFSFFTFGFIVSLGICLLLASYNYLLTSDLKSFYYGELSFFHHPTYMAMYGSTSLIYLYLSLLAPNKFETHYLKTDIMKMLLIAVISVFILLLMSKAGVLIMLIINTIGILAVFKSKQKLKQSFLLLFGLCLIVGGSYLTIKPLQKRVDEVWTSLTSDSKTESSTGARLLVWNASWQIIKKHPVVGVGTGDLSNELDNIYWENNFAKLFKKSYNSHNQLLETWAKSGVIGLLSLIGLFTYSFSFRSLQNKLYLFFVLLVIINMLMESILQIQSGVVFVAFMNSMFAVSIIRQKG